MADDVNNLGTTPIGTTPNNVPTHIQDLKDAINAGSINRRLTGAQIAALSAAQKPAGVIVYNTTAGTPQVSNGSTFDNVAVGAVYAVGTRTTSQSLTAGQWNDITYTAEDDASAMLATATGVVTIPQAGLWIVQGFVEVSSSSGASSDAFVAGIVHSGAYVAQQSASSANTVVAHSMHVSALVVAAASDTVKLAAYNGAAGARNATKARLGVARLIRI